MVVRAPDVPPAIVVHVMPVRHRESNFRTMRAAAIVLAVEPKAHVQIDRHMLQAILGLTPTESDVAARSAEGHSVREIAEALGRAELTVRWHIKQSHRKLRVSHQSDLIRIVQAVGGTLPPER